MATIPCDELTAKRAVTMDSLVAEAYAYSSPMKKHKIDEEDDGYSDSESSLGDLESLCDEEWVAYKRMPGREPEWDVDSFDGREFRDNPGLRKLFPTQERYDEYLRDRLHAFESKGFLPDPLRGIYEVYLDGPMDNHNTARDFMADLANVCVKKFNETKGKTLELVNVVRVNESGGAKWKLYITFMAREYHEGPLVEYQAKVIKFLGDVQPPFPILCRPSPKPEI